MSNEHLDNSFKELKEFFKDVNLSQAVDIGCKNDYMAQKIQKHFKIPCITMDLKDGEGVYIKGAMEDIPLHNNIVDLIFCSHTFEHTTNPIQTIKEFHRILKPSGFIYLKTPVPCIEAYYTLDDTHNFVLNLDQLGVLFQRYGFKISKTAISEDKSSEDKDKGQVMIMVKV